MPSRRRYCAALDLEDRSVPSVLEDFIDRHVGRDHTAFERRRLYSLQPTTDGTPISDLLRMNLIARRMATSSWLVRCHP